MQAGDDADVCICSGCIGAAKYIIVRRDIYYTISGLSIDPTFIYSKRVAFVNIRLVSHTHCSFPRIFASRRWEIKSSQQALLIIYHSVILYNILFFDKKIEKYIFQIFFPLMYTLLCLRLILAKFVLISLKCLLLGVSKKQCAPGLNRGFHQIFIL